MAITAPSTTRDERMVRLGFDRARKLVRSAAEIYTETYREHGAENEARAIEHFIKCLIEADCSQYRHYDAEAL